jgi:predicted nucleic acid-binding protein
MTFIDADVWIDFLCGAEPGAAAAEKLLGERRAALSVVSAFELLCGATRPRQIEQLESLLKALDPLPLTLGAVRHAAVHYRRLRRDGLLIGNQDLLLAGAAIDLGWSILTRNRDHFARVAGLEVLAPLDIHDEAAIGGTEEE